MFSSLYVSRPLLNAGEVAEHFARQGLLSVLAPADMHVTIVYSKQTMDWNSVSPAPETLVVPPGGKRAVERFGDSGEALVMRFDSPALTDRWQEYRQAGASHDFNGYKPHVTITYKADGVDANNILPFAGALHFGPERKKPVVEGWRPKDEKETAVSDLLDKAVVARLPVIIKALPVDTSGRRIVEVEASCEAVDYDGDVVLQEALLRSAASFVATGHLDLDHMSEFGARLGIPDPASYIVGRPLEVTSAEGKRTFVRGEIRRSIDGTVNPARNRYDEFWESLQSDPPVQWYSSIYGFPTDMENCQSGMCTDTGALRYLIKAMDWRSLAFTRTPKNTALRDATRIVTAKSYFAELAKSMSTQVPTIMPQTMDDVMAAQACPNCEVHKAPSLLGYRQHFMVCKGWPAGVADVCAHAISHRNAMKRAVAR